MIEARFSAFNPNALFIGDVEDGQASLNDFMWGGAGQVDPSANQGWDILSNGRLIRTASNEETNGDMSVTVAFIVAFQISAFPFDAIIRVERRDANGNFKGINGTPTTITHVGQSVQLSFNDQWSIAHRFRFRTRGLNQVNNCGMSNVFSRIEYFASVN